ncbi:MAG: triose-phosphate isomerase [Litorivicinaceae bacterium]
MILGNWKMHTLKADALELAAQMRVIAENAKAPIGVCPPALWIDSIVGQQVSSRLLVGVQDCVADDFGAHTGCVNASMVADAGCAFALLGHSERRQRFGETTDTIVPAVGAILETGLFPVVCVGETEADREAGRADQVVAEQLLPLLGQGFDLDGIVIAYEPVWAIGTGRVPTLPEIVAMHRWIREVLGQPEHVVLYGGSVSPETAPQIFSSDQVSGALVGGASLDAEKFAAIVAAWETR